MAILTEIDGITTIMSDVTVDANKSSSVVSLLGKKIGSLHIVWDDDTLGGSISVKAGNIPEPTQEIATLAAMAGETEYFLRLGDIDFAYLKFDVTHSANSAIMSGYVVAKE